MKHVFILSIMLLTIACSHPKPLSREDREFKGTNFYKMYQKERTYEALNNDLTALCDRILNFSSKNWVLNANENKALEEFVRQNKLFEQQGFDQAWLDHSKVMFDRILTEEQNMIAPAIYQKLEDLYFEQKKN